MDRQRLLTWVVGVLAVSASGLGLGYGVARLRTPDEPPSTPLSIARLPVGQQPAEATRSAEPPPEVGPGVPGRRATSIWSR